RRKARRSSLPEASRQVPIPGPRADPVMATATPPSPSGPIAGDDHQEQGTMSIASWEEVDTEVRRQDGDAAAASWFAKEGTMAFRVPDDRKVTAPGSIAANWAGCRPYFRVVPLRRVEGERGEGRGKSSPGASWLPLDEFRGRRSTPDELRKFFAKDR